MIEIVDIRVRTVSTPVFGTVIHGQGQNKKYCYIEVNSNDGIFYAEIYPGLYSSALVEAAVEEVSNRACGRNFSDISALRRALHIPFITGAGVYQAVTGAFLNAVQHNKPLRIDLKADNIHPYLSGGTVKTSTDQMSEEIALCKALNFACYKVRLDYRDRKDCEEKIALLNNSEIRYAVDFICNTNHSDFNEKVLLGLLDLMDPRSVEWIEEPVIPHEAWQQGKFLSEIDNKGFATALGESLTSPLEFWALDNISTVGLIQLDATINGDYEYLRDYARCCSSKLGAHNWGSIITSLQNAVVFSGFGKDIFFEIPIYETDFDREVAATFGISLKEPCGWSQTDIVIDEKVGAVISRFAVESAGDFNWS